MKNVTPKHLEPITEKLRRAGVEVEEFDDAVRVRRTGDILPLKINTMPHPGFPTDMQPLMGVLLSVAKGTSTVTESVWDNRFRYVDELRKMGANVQVDGQVAVFEGVDKLSPAPLRALDLRAGAAMVVAALMADGTSEIEEIGHIERGYENIVEAARSGCRYQKGGTDACRTGSGVVTYQKINSLLAHMRRAVFECIRGFSWQKLSHCIPALPATAAWCAAVHYLIVDMGKGVRTTTAALKALGLAVSDCDGILITHEHSDHVKGLSTFLGKRTRCRCMARRLHWIFWMPMGSSAACELHELEGREEDVGAFGVRAFPTSHDAPV